MSDIPEKLQELVNAELMDDETIQWIEQPVVSFDGVLRIFCLSFAITFLIFYACGVAGLFAQNLLGFVGSSLLTATTTAFAIWQTAGQSAKQVVYVITNFRAMIVHGTPRVLKVTNYYPAELSYLARIQRANGTGHLYFRAGPSDRNNNLWGFMNIRNVKEVERLLQDLKRTKSAERM